ncbi:MAG: peptidyl-prolyl cis-trans isomerase [Thermoanaerobaculia bacterium]|nr:peptidyl-prolyl cis-trans isomerase [Thermoanaerobaculia bacterium]MCZ7652931.1 peptidylprolyl isomerase [Thermoanaerobaculia bacterium]
MKWLPACPLLLLAALAACAAPGDLPGPDVVARLAGGDVRRAEFDAYLARNIGEGGEALASAPLSALFDRFLEELLLCRLAEQRGVAKRGDPPRRAIDALLAADGPLAPSEEEVALYYGRHSGQFRTPERVRLWQLLTGDRRVAERARRDLAAGGRFETVLERAQREDAAADGRLEGEMALADLPPVLAGAVARLAPGETSGVVEAEYGFHVFRLEARTPARTQPLPEAAPEIRRQLARQRADARLAELLAAAERGAAVTVYDRTLPFTYSGRFPVARPYG